ncbi:MAG: glycosyltransferase family 39 protein [Candidatus Omnitrophota bacterium]
MKELRFSREALLLFGIMILAFALRLWGVGFGLPFLYHADEPIVVNHALAFGTGDFNPHFFNIPPLVSYLLFGCYGIFWGLGHAAGWFQSLRDFEQLFYFDPSSFYLIARLVFGVFLGTLSVYALFRLAKRMGTMPVALWACFFLAVNFLHARDSHYIYADIPLLFVLLTGFMMIFRLAEAPSSLKGHLFVGSMIGLATATKYNGAFLAIPYLWIFFRCVPWKRWFVSGLVAAGAASAAFVILNPYAVLDHAFFVKELAEQSAANSGGLSWSHHLTYSLAGALGWPMLILALLGVFPGLFSKDVKLQSVAVFVAGYYVVLCRFGQPYDRYVLPLVPWMVFLAAGVLLRVKARSALVFWVLVPFVVLPSVLKIVHWDQLMSKPDVRTVTKNWVEDHIPAGSRLALDGAFYMPRLAFSPSQLEEKKARAAGESLSAAKIRRIEALLAKPLQPSYELNFLSEAPEGSSFLFSEPRVPFDLEVLKKNGIQYVLLVDALRPDGDPFFQGLLTGADRVVTFSPYRDREDMTIHDPQAMTGGPFLWGDTLPRERGGYPITIYRIRS